MSRYSDLRLPESIAPPPREQPGRMLPSELADEGIAGVKATRLSAGPPPRDYTRKKWTRLDIDLAVVRVDVRYRIAGTLVFAADSTLITDLLQIRLDTLENDPIPFRPGTYIGGCLFSDLYFTNAAIAGSVMNIMISRDYPDDRILVES